MKPRTKILFKINNEVVLEETTDLYLNQIDELKWSIALECECTIDDIEIEKIELSTDVSDEVDISQDGMVFWKSLYMQPIQGVFCELEEGSDLYLDAVLDGTIDRYLNFFI